MSFELNRQSSTYKSYASVLHLSIGGKSGSVGDRTPSIWFHPRVGVYIVTTLNGEANVGKKFRTHKPTIGEWTSFQISQTKKSSTYTFSVTIAGKEVWSEENGKPQEFGAVRVYGSSPWYEAQAGSIRGLLIENKQLGKIKQCKKNILPKFSFVVEPQEWRPWGEWSQCTASCGQGSRVRSRACSEPAIDGNAICLGEALEFEDCYAADCPWSEWSPCTASCGKGSRVRSRPCGEQVVDSNKPCSGSEMEFADCVSVECPGQSPKSSQTNTLNNINHYSCMASLGSMVPMHGLLWPGDSG